MIKTAVVILNWNGKHFLEKFLPSVVRYSAIPGVRVIVADNGSTDDSVSFLKKSYPDIGILQFDRNHGFAEGYNRALKQIEAEYYILLNSDVEVTESWIEPVIEFMDSDKGIAGCMPKIKDYHRQGYFEYAGAAGGYIDRFGYIFCRGRIFNIIEEDKGQYDNTVEIFWGTGTCLFIRAEAFHGAGGFDGDFFAHMEEIDLCWRLKNRGNKIFFHPGSQIYHVGGGALPMNHPHKTYLNFRNSLYMLHKNLPHNRFRREMAFRQLLDVIAAIKFLLSLEIRNFLSVIQANMAYWRSIPSMNRKRRENQQYVITETHQEMYHRSIVWDFFFRKKRRFSELKWLPSSAE